MKTERFEELEAILPITQSSKDCPYWWDEHGVWSKSGKRTNQLAFRPILPIARGVDQDGELYLELLWIDSLNQERRMWLRDSVARDPSELQALPGSPADASKKREIARWIGFASGKLDSKASPLVNLATRLGWIGLEFVWPGHMCERTWVGAPLEEPGNLEIVTRAVRTLATLPDGAGNLALVALGLSAASPLVRFGCSRNPILGMAQTSSRGKTTAIKLALSIWGPPPRWSFQANSSPKGIEDKGVTFPDTPIFLDDLHVRVKQNPDAALSTLYFLGNGQRRIVASKDLDDTLGGQSRFGVSFYAAEEEILTGAMGGIQRRTWELEGDPMPNGEVANQIEAAAYAGQGAIAPLLAEYYTRRADAWHRRLDLDHDVNGFVISTQSLSAGDVKAVRALASGLDALRTVLRIPEINVIEICEQLIAQISTSRATAVDSVKAAWDSLLSSVLGAQWGREYVRDGMLVVGHPNTLFASGEVVAERAQDAANDWSKLYINPGSRFARQALPKGSSVQTLVKTWAARGYILRPPSSHLKHNIRAGGQDSATRVWILVAPEQLSRWTDYTEEEGALASPAPLPPLSTSSNAAPPATSEAPIDLFSP